MEENQYIQLEEVRGKSYFDGGVFSLLGWTLLGTLITLVTLGLCLPWAICMVINWAADHTVIEGRRLRFSGSAIGLFGNWIKWWLLGVVIGLIFGFLLPVLSPVAVFIYGVWVQIAMIRWVVKYTGFRD